MARAIGETTPIITIDTLTFIAFLLSSPIGEVVPLINFEGLFAAFAVMSIETFNWTSHPEAAFQANAAAAGLVFALMTVTMSGTAAWLRCRLRCILHSGISDCAP